MPYYPPASIPYHTTAGVNGDNLFAGVRSGNPSGIQAAAHPNCAFGPDTFVVITTGNFDSAFGSNAGALVTTGSFDTFLGNHAGGRVTTGSYITLAGLGAGENFTTSDRVTGVGMYVLVSMTGGNDTTAVGMQAGGGAGGVSTNRDSWFGTYSFFGATVSADNVGVGFMSGHTLTAANTCTTSTKMTFLGTYTGLASTTQRTRSGAIGYGALVDADNAIVIGGSGADAVSLGINTPIPLAWLHVPASTTARASLTIPSGTAPTSPNNGDIWFDGTDLKIRIGGATKTVTVL